LPQPVLQVQGYVFPLRTINSYGLFAVMTTTRPEIIVEGSDDGVTWKAYAFRYKPGEDLTRRPPFCTPHMPRLGWQVWVAALGGVRGNEWVVTFMVRLLQNEPTVIGLLRENPFGNRAPRYVRAVLYDYRFTTPAERRKTGAWWRRQRLGLYCPV